MTLPDILLIDKPKGITSFDVIRELRKRTGIEKMGHAGTLDPLATGLLIIGVGKGTKQLAGFLKLPKVYRAEVRFGIRTDTGDITGAVVEEKPHSGVAEAPLCAALAGLMGRLDLPVPVYSAIKKAGRPLYAYARSGRPVVPPVRPMTVTAGQLISYAELVATVEWSVESGTYIRSLAEEFGRRLGTVATLQELRRLSIGRYSVDDATPLGQF